jgi:RecB family exonuclease
MQKSRVWSSSKIGTLFGCPQAYKLKYIDHVKVPTNIKVAFGAAIHYMLEEFYKKNFKSTETFLNKWDFYWTLACSQKNIDEINPKIKKYYEKIRKRYGEVYVHNEEARRYIIAAYKRIGKNILTKFYIRHKNKPKPFEFEKRFNMNVNSFRLQGIIDRIDEFKGGLCITDYKTDKKCPKENDLLIRKNHQLTIYYLALKELYNCDPTAIFMYHLRSGKVIPTIRTKKDIDFLENTLEKAEKIVKNKEFDPFYGFHCNWCDYLKVCQEKEVEKNLKSIIDQEETDLFWGLEERL